jgi:integrase
MRIRGSGTVTAAGTGKWRLRVSADGKRLSRVVAGTRPQADKALRGWLAEIDSGQVATSTMTVGEAVGRHADEQERRGLATKTVRRSRTMPADHLPAVVLRMPIKDLRHRHLEEAYQALGAAGAKPGTVRALAAVMSGVCTWAQRQELVQGNVARLARVPGVQPERHDPPTVEQLAKLVEAADQISPAAGMLVRLAAATGARRGELAALRWTDVDWERHTLSVARSLVEAGGPPVEGPTKTRTRRVISIDVGTVGLLRAWQAEQADLARLCEAQLLPDGFVLAAQELGIDGTVPWSPDRMTRAFERARDKVKGCERIRLHDLRHAHATMLLELGVPLHVVSGRLGHGAETTTARTYAHFVERTDRAAADLIGALVHGPARLAVVETGT